MIFSAQGHTDMNRFTVLITSRNREVEVDRKKENLQFDVILEMTAI